MSNESELTAEILRKALHYDPKTGIFTWKISTKNNVRAGDVAGSTMRTGYKKVNFYGKYFAAHRLAWFFYYGEEPDGMIDHINGDKTDNRITNLRLADHRINQLNRESHRNGKSPGCSYHKNIKRWTAQIRISGKLQHLGSFKTEKQAANAYKDAVKKLYDATTIAESDKNLRELLG